MARASSFILAMPSLVKGRSSSRALPFIGLHGDAVAEKIEVHLPIVRRTQRDLLRPGMRGARR